MMEFVHAQTDEPAGYDLAEVEVDEATTPARKRPMDGAKIFVILTHELKDDVDPFQSALHLKIPNFSNPKKEPSKNSTPSCASPTVGANCRGINTADVRFGGLDDGTIARVSLKGFMAHKGHKGFYTSSAPLRR